LVQERQRREWRFWVVTDYFSSQPWKKGKSKRRVVSPPPPPIFFPEGGDPPSIIAEIRIRPPYPLSLFRPPYSFPRSRHFSPLTPESPREAPCRQLGTGATFSILGRGVTGQPLLLKLFRRGGPPCCFGGGWGVDPVFFGLSCFVSRPLILERLMTLSPAAFSALLP
jgi:hypothetical protein